MCLLKNWEQLCGIFLFQTNPTLPATEWHACRRIKDLFIGCLANGHRKADLNSTNGAWGEVTRSCFIPRPVRYHHRRLRVTKQVTGEVCSGQRVASSGFSLSFASCKENSQFYLEDFCAVLWTLHKPTRRAQPPSCSSLKLETPGAGRVMSPAGDLNPWLSVLRKPDKENPPEPKSTQNNQILH